MGYTKNETPVMRDSRKLCYYTLRVTQNLNNFPKKYRYTLVDRLISSALDIHDNISDANLSWGSERIAYQTEAIKSCRKMDFYLQCVYEVLKPKCSIPHVVPLAGTWIETSHLAFLVSLRLCRSPCGNVD